MASNPRLAQHQTPENTRDPNITLQETSPKQKKRRSQTPAVTETDEQKTAASKRKLCGRHAGSCHASLVQSEEVTLAFTDEIKSGGEDGRPRADQRGVDSPRLLFSLMLFSCSCSNRTVNNNNNNNNSREKR